MSRKKRKALEEQKRLEVINSVEPTAESSFGNYGYDYRDFNGCMLPVYSGKMRAIQLPPIIQPVAIMPYGDQEQRQSSHTETITKIVEKMDDFDEFDDFDDWCD